MSAALDGIVAWLLAGDGGGGSSFEVLVVDELPEVGQEGIMYLVPKQGGTAPDYSEEYVWVKSLTRYELVGTTATVFNTREETWIDEDGVSYTVTYHIN